MVLPSSLVPRLFASDESTFDEVFGVNAAIAPAMAERGGGAIINLGSWIAFTLLAWSVLPGR